MIKFEIVNPADWMDSIQEMLQANWAETGFDFEFNPDVYLYQQLHKVGMMFAVAALDDDKLIGYCNVAMVRHLHNQDVLCAANDALYVMPEYRKGLTAGRLILAAEKEAKSRGATKFSWHCRAGTPFADMLIKHGYKPADLVVVKGI